MPQDVTPNDDASSNSTVISKEQDNTKLVTSFTTAMEKKMSAEESAEIAADIAAAAADKRLEMCEQRYIEKLKKFGMILDIKDLAQQEEQEKAKQRKIAARKADAERMWTNNDLNELREEFNKFDTSPQDGTILGKNVKIILQITINLKFIIAF